MTNQNELSDYIIKKALAEGAILVGFCGHLYKCTIKSISM